MGRLSGYKYRVIIQILKKFGFEFHRQATGSHEIWFNPQTNKYTTIPNHLGDMPEGTLNAILKQAVSKHNRSDMRNILILLVLTLILSFDIKAQEFAPVGASWYYSEWQFNGLPILESYINIVSEKDTIINEKDCKKLVNNKRIWCSDRPKTEYVYSQNDTVFFFDPNFNEFQILYDFNAERNQFWNIKMRNWRQAGVDTVKIRVDSTDFVSINNNSLRRLYVTYQIILNDGHILHEYPSEIIKTIGDIKYMFNYLPSDAEVCDANGSGGLRCYSDSIIGFYTTNIASSCDEIVYWTANEELKNNDLSQTHITADGNFITIISSNQRIVSYSIYSLTGKLIKSKIIDNDKINIDDLMPAMYILNLYDEDKKVSNFKFLK